MRGFIGWADPVAAAIARLGGPAMPPPAATNCQVVGGFDLTEPMELTDNEIMSAGAIDSGEFRKRPVVVKAYRYKGRAPKTLQTLEGPMTAKPGDWIITGVEGEKYACDDVIFRKTYEPVGKTKGVRQAFRRSG